LRIGTACSQRISNTTIAVSFLVDKRPRRGDIYESNRFVITDPRAVPLETFVADVMRLLGESTSEIIVDEVRESRWAERTGLYDALFAKRNEGTG